MGNKDKLFKEFVKATNRLASAYRTYQDELYSGDELSHVFIDYSIEEIDSANEIIEELLGLAETLGDETLLNKMKTNYDKAKRRMKIAEMEAKLRR